MVVLAITMLLLTALYVIFHYSRKVIREEAMGKATEMLEYTVTKIDNVLLNVEQAAGNFYIDLLMHLDQPERMFDYSRELVESNPYITGCAIAFEPYFYKEKGKYFMAYVHRTTTDTLNHHSDSLIQSSTYGKVLYLEQIWYEKPIRMQCPYWVTLKNEAADGESIITFSLPIYYQGKLAGVMGVDVSLKLLSTIVSAAKPSENSYAILLDKDGSYIVHPDTSRLFHESIFSPTNPIDSTMFITGKSMIAGETDHRPVISEGKGAHVFYKPFKRSAVPGRSIEDIGWSIGIVYPDEDIFGDYKRLLPIALVIAVAGLLLLLLLCRTYTHRQLLPLRHLTASAQRITDGDFDTPILDCRQHDEVGRLQEHFQQMQQALSSNVGELQQLTDSLREQGKVLADAYEHAKVADRMKIKFLHNMTNQMIEPATIMYDDVEALCNPEQVNSQEQIDHLVEDILRQGELIAELLNQLLESSRDQEPMLTNT